MSLHDAVIRAKEAAAHAKPFMKLIDALSALDGELRATGKLESDAEATAKKKADLEASIPALQSQANAAQHTLNSYKAQMSSIKANFEAELEKAKKASEDDLKAKLAAVMVDHESKVSALKNEISTLGGTLSTLEKQKADIEAQIGALRKSIEGARAAFHV